MKIKLRRSQERGHADHGWLDSYHTFSFADYYDPAHMGFRSLRVINQDRIAPGGGFPKHPHRDMEIFSYLVEGALQHQDSLGNGRVLLPGQIQMMSTGKGVQHSEFNPSKSELSHLLQIWIQPEARGLTPSYTEWHPDPAKEKDPKVLVISRDGREGSATIHQDADVYRVRLPSESELTHDVHAGHGVWFQLIRGSVICGDQTLNAGDAISTEDGGKLTLKASRAPLDSGFYFEAGFGGLKSASSILCPLQKVASYFNRIIFSVFERVFLGFRPLLRWLYRLQRTKQA